MLDETFTGTLGSSEATGGRTDLVADWTARHFVARGLVKVAGTSDGEPSRTR